MSPRSEGSDSSIKPASDDEVKKDYIPIKESEILRK